MYSLEEFDKQKTKVLKYIIYKKRTENEVRTKFSKDMDEELLEDIIEYLKEAEYINDYEYVEKTINQYIILKNLSIKELTYKLYTKGISKNIIEKYLEENYEELNDYERKSAGNIISKKESSMEMEEIKMYLLRKGYKSDNIELGDE